MTSESLPLDRHLPRRNVHAARRAFLRWLKRGLLLMLALGAVGGLVWAWLPKPVAVDVAVARRGPLQVTVDEEGKTRVRDRYVVTAPITGNLQRVELEVGAPIEHGQVIARIEPSDPALLDPRTRDQATAQLAAANARAGTAAAAVARARAARTLADRDAERTRVLEGRGAVTASAREHDDLTAQLAAQDLAAAEQQQRAALAEVAGARAVLGEGGHRGGAAPVAAPASGSLLRLVRESAGPIAAGAPILELGDLGALEIVIDVLSSDGARIAPGMSVAIAAWGGERELQGRVVRVEPSAFTRVSALGVEEQRVNVVAVLDAAPARLGDAFRVDARIVIWDGDAVVVPSSAVFRERGSWAVYAVEAGRAHLRHVDLGHLGHLDVEIAGGLEPGTAVVLHPGDQVVDGTRVTAR